MEALVVCRIRQKLFAPVRHVGVYIFFSESMRRKWMENGGSLIYSKIDLDRSFLTIAY